MKNLRGKTVTRDKAYEVYRTPDRSWTWYVLKHYQSPEAEAKNPYARVLADVTSPIVGERGEIGDTYLSDITSVAVLVSRRELPEAA